MPLPATPPLPSSVLTGSPGTSWPIEAALAALAPQAREVLDFWFADGLQLGWPSQNLSKVWFGGGAELDSQITARFGALVREAAGGRFTEWEITLPACLALVIVLDQFSRNVFRGSAQAFASDARALRLAKATLAAGEDLQLPWAARVFMYMPLMHSEELSAQELCVGAFTRLRQTGPEALAQKFQGHLDYAIQHRDIVARFGRFPHRNAVLGRSSTPEEEHFLHSGPRFGQ